MIQMQSSAAALSSNLKIESKLLDKITPLTTSCPHRDLQIKKKNKKTGYLLSWISSRGLPFPGLTYHTSSW